MISHSNPIIAQPNTTQLGWFNIKLPSYQYRKSQCGDKTILRPYVHNIFHILVDDILILNQGPLYIRHIDEISKRDQDMDDRQDRPRTRLWIQRILIYHRHSFGEQFVNNWETIDHITRTQYACFDFIIIHYGITHNLSHYTKINISITV